MPTVKGNFNFIDSLAYKELERVKNLSAFNIQGATDKRKLNQYAATYHFNDGSDLKILSRRSLGVVTCPTINGYMSQPLKINTQGE